MPAKKLILMLAKFDAEKEVQSTATNKVKANVDS